MDEDVRYTLHAITTEQRIYEYTLKETVDYELYQSIRLPDWDFVMVVIPVYE